MREGCVRCTFDCTNVAGLCSFPLTVAAVSLRRARLGCWKVVNGTKFICFLLVIYYALIVVKRDVQCLGPNRLEVCKSIGTSCR